MDDETRELLERVLQLEQENNKMLKKIRSHARWSTAFSFIYWTIILGSSAAAFYYVQPFLSGLLASYQSLAATAQKANGAFQGIDPKVLQNINDALKTFGGGSQ